MISPSSCPWEFEPQWTRFSGLAKGGNLWVRSSPKLRREVRFARDIEYWHWLLVEIEPEIVTFCERPVPKHLSDPTISALPDMWLKRETGLAEFRSVARSERQTTSTARFLGEMFGSGFTYRPLSQEEVLAEPVLLDNALRIVGFLSLSRPIHIKLSTSIQDVFLINESQTLGELISKFAPIFGQEAVLHALFSLIQKGALQADLHKTLSETTKIEVGRVSRCESFVVR